MWTYRAPSVVLGCAQRALVTEVRERLGTEAGVLVRESGGGAALTGQWLVSVSVAVPAGHAWARGSALDAYARMAGVHLGVLAELGIPARAVAPDSAALSADATRSPVRWACWGSLSPWEIVDDAGRKLVGLAQRRRSTAALLVAGTLVSRPDWELLCKALGHMEHLPRLRAGTTDCRSLAGAGVTATRLAARLRNRFRAALVVGAPGAAV